MKNLTQAKRNKQGEFYTRYVDIEKEIIHYYEHLKNKIIYCNCDNPSWSNFILYFKNNFKSLELKQLICTYYSNDETAYCTTYSWDNELNQLIETSSRLNGNGDFRNEECIQLMHYADVIITNPPFSLFREYMNLLLTNNKQFLVIGNLNAVKYIDIFPYIRDNKIWLGCSPRSMTFDLDIERTKSKDVNACWFTNMEHNKRKSVINLTCQYNPDDYPKYDNYDAIEVSKVSNIPMDYDGVMGVPITFIEKYNPSQFAILGVTKKGLDGGVWLKDAYNCLINGEIKFDRFFIKRIT